MNGRPYALGVGDALDAMRRGDLDCHAYTREILARIDATDGDIEAWAFLDRGLALRAALHADARRDWDPTLPLAGIPFGVKDIIATSDQPTSLGSPIYAGARSPYDAHCVMRLAQSGAFVLGKTVTTEFAFMHPGKTKNPWHAAYTPGGSSSGSAAAVAIGHVPAALGTQTNGSIVRPAAFCGIVGFKPTTDVMPFEGVNAFSPSFDTVGVFARSVADCARVASVIANVGVIANVPANVEQRPRFALLREYPWIESDADMHRALDAFAARLADAGAIVEPVEVPAALLHAIDVHRTIMLREAAQQLRDLQSTERARMSDVLNAAIDEGVTIDDARYGEAADERFSMIDAAREWLGGYHAIVSPPAPGTAPADLSVTGDPRCCTLWSLLGFPAIAIPIAVAPNGLPLGAQLATLDGKDGRLLAAAAWCESRVAFRGLLERER